MTFENQPIPNGTTVTVLGSYKCIGQVCDHKNGFAGRRYSVVILESDLLREGEVHMMVEDLIVPIKNYQSRK